MHVGTVLLILILLIITRLMHSATQPALNINNILLLLNKRRVIILAHLLKSTQKQANSIQSVSANS